MKSEPFSSSRLRLIAGAVVVVVAAAAYWLKAAPDRNIYKTLMIIGVLISISSVPRFDYLKIGSISTSSRGLIGIVAVTGILLTAGAMFLILGFSVRVAIIGMAASVVVAIILFAMSRLRLT